MKTNPDYLLPNGVLGNDEIVCQLVYLPNRAEYWQALLTELHYLATWQAWERDEDKRGKDAASNWREAFELTMECWRMTCLEDLQSDVSDILDHLRNNVPCCGDNITYGDSTVYVTTIINGDGDPPSHYGETGVADWDEWEEYLCHNAHLWVDELIDQAGNIEVALTTGGMSMGLLAAAIAGIALFVVGGFISVPVLMLGVAGLAVGISATLFEDAADDIEAARDDIICAIINDNDLAGAVETALGSGSAWDLFYTLIDYDSAMAILYEGGDGETYLDAERDATCDCEQIGEYESFQDFETVTLEGWQTHGGAVSGAFGVDDSYGVRLQHANTEDIYTGTLGIFGFINELGYEIGDKIILHRMEFWYWNSFSGHTGQLRIDHDGGLFTEELSNYSTWQKKQLVFSPPLELTHSITSAIRIICLAGSTYSLGIDEIFMDIDVEWA